MIAVAVHNSGLPGEQAAVTDFGFGGLTVLLGLPLFLVLSPLLSRYVWRALSSRHISRSK